MIYRGKKQNEIIFPLGGIGTGSIGLTGNGSLVDWEIFNRPNKGSINHYSFFAIKAVLPDGKSITKVLQGDHAKYFTGQYTKTEYSGYGFGPNRSTMCGFPHFKKVIFDGKFPIATLTFEDDDFPARVVMKAFNPFIPLDADNSSIPAAFFEISIKSFLDNVKFTVVFSVSNPFACSVNKKVEHAMGSAIKLSHYGKNNSDLDYGDLTVAVAKNDSFCQEYWYRGRWQDNITTFWNEFTDGDLKNRHYDQAGRRDVASVGANTTIGKAQTDTFRFVLSWNIPNNYNYWNPCTDEQGNHISWKNYYATLFFDSTKSNVYCFDNWDELYHKTNCFCRFLHESTLDKYIIDAVSSNLSILKSPTVLRLEDGTLYGWEGVQEIAGCCEGTCTHVWSYAYALCFLFPELERSLRNTEFTYDTDVHGKMHFRTALPLGNGHVGHTPCVDGQMATIIKVYRDWKITGNSKWLADNWGNVKKVLEYAWSEHNEHEWDRDKDGVLEGRQHHTLDMELFGPSSWLQGMYLGALKAASEMAGFLGDTSKQSEYAEQFEKGYKWTKENLFNGKYFYHKVDLTDKTPTDYFNCPNYWDSENGELKYQIGEGCEIDQLLGQWHASICGLGDIFDKEQRQIALKNMMQNNFKSPLRNFANMWRIFALNDESGTIMCDYPADSKKPAIPIPYCDECMSGFEYSFAGLLISEGFLEAGLKVVHAIRNRYDGEKRNPWNEIEYGSNYARSMASFALLPIFSGFHFDLPQKHIGFSPIVEGNFKCFWSLGTGWGNFVKTKKCCRILIAAGSLNLEQITIGNIGNIKSLSIDGKRCAFTQKGSTIIFDCNSANHEINIEV